MPKCALYARVSTIDKNQDPEVQLIRLRNFAEARGFEVHDEYVDFTSGADPNRPELTRMLQDARKRTIHAILIVRLDRMMRSTINLLEVVKDLELWNVNLVVLDQPVETGTAIGRLLITVLGAVAEFERELLRERTIDGMAKAKAHGTRSGRPIGRPPAIIPPDVVQEALRLLDAGKGLRMVSSTLGVPRSSLRRAVEEARAVQKGGPSP